MKGGIFLDDNMSNLTSASNEAISQLSSSSNRNEICTMYPPPPPPPPQMMQHQSSSFASVPINTNINQTHQSNKKKRNLPGNPDPEAEVVALSPKSLMATNRFICEICNKGFQRDQNLQLHRRGHNLPWKLKQKSKLEVVKKKVYVCPEPSCVHHEPSRALGDLTGIKKHFSRKHGEKKWKCEKCSKRYAVQSDWKAHSKICGTREYRCDCGTLFSRRDSFITHRAFCDALAEETHHHHVIRSSINSQSNHHDHLPPLHLPIINFPLKSEPYPQLSFKVGSSSSPHHHHQLPSWLDHNNNNQQQQNPNPNINLQYLPSPSSTSSHMMSATALLQKAAQMGVTMSSSNSPSPNSTTATAAANINILLNNNSNNIGGTHRQSLQQQHAGDDHMCAPQILSSHHGGLSTNLSASDDNNHHHHVMLEPNNSSSGFANCMDQMQLLHHHQDPNLINSLTSTSVGGLSSSTNYNNEEMSFMNSMLSTKKLADHNMMMMMSSRYQQQQQRQREEEEGAGGGCSSKKLDGMVVGNIIKEQQNELTRDFLGLRGLMNPNDDDPRSNTEDHGQHFINMQLQAGNTLDHHQLINPNQNQMHLHPWQG